MKVFKIILNITLASSLLINSAGQNYLSTADLTERYALRPMASEKSGEIDLAESHPGGQSKKLLAYCFGKICSSPKTIRQLSNYLNLSESTIRGYINTLINLNLAVKIGMNKYGLDLDGMPGLDNLRARDEIESCLARRTRSWRLNAAELPGIKKDMRDILRGYGEPEELVYRFTADIMDEGEAYDFLGSISARIQREFAEIAKNLSGKNKIINPQDITEQDVDYLLGDFEGCLSLRAQIENCLKRNTKTLYTALSTVNHPKRPPPKIYFMPGDMLWEINGHFTAGYFSKTHNSIYIKYGFVKYIREYSHSPEEAEVAVKDLALRLGFLMELGITHPTSSMSRLLLSPDRNDLDDLFMKARANMRYELFQRRHPAGLEKFNSEHKGLYAEIRPNAKFRVEPSECLKILGDLYQEEGVDFHDLRVLIDRFPAENTFTEGVDIVPHYDSEADLIKNRKGSDISLNITINTRAFEYEGGLTDLKQALRNAIRDYQDKPKATPLSVKGYTTIEDKKKRAFTFKIDPDGFTRSLNDNIIWRINSAHWKYGAEKKFLDEYQASGNPSFVREQVEDFFDDYLARHDPQDKEKITIAELSAGSCRHADLWLRYFKELQDEYNRRHHGTAPLNLFERLVFVIADVSLEELKKRITPKNTPFLWRHKDKLKLAEVDLSILSDYLMRNESRRLDISEDILDCLNKSCLVMVNYSYNLMPVSIFSKKGEEIYEDRAFAYLSPEIDEDFIKRHRTELRDPAVGVTNMEELKEFLSDMDRYESALRKKKLSYELIQELWNGIRLQSRNLNLEGVTMSINAPLMESVKEFLANAGLDNVTMPVNLTFDWNVAGIMRNWLADKHGRLELLDTIMEEPIEYQTRFWQLRKYGASLASWINYRYFQDFWLKRYIAERSRWPSKVDVDAAPLNEIIEETDKARGTLLRLQWVSVGTILPSQIRLLRRERDLHTKYKTKSTYAATAQAVDMSQKSSSRGDDGNGSYGIIEPGLFYKAVYDRGGRDGIAVHRNNVPEKKRGWVPLRVCEISELKRKERLEATKALRGWLKKKERVEHPYDIENLVSYLESAEKMPKNYVSTVKRVYLALSSPKQNGLKRIDVEGIVFALKMPEDVTLLTTWAVNPDNDDDDVRAKREALVMAKKQGGEQAVISATEELSSSIERSKIRFIDVRPQLLYYAVYRELRHLEGRLGFKPAAAAIELMNEGLKSCVDTSGHLYTKTELGGYVKNAIRHVLEVITAAAPEDKGAEKILSMIEPAQESIFPGPKIQPGIETAFSASA